MASRRQTRPAAGSSGNRKVAPLLVPTHVSVVLARGMSYLGPLTERSPWHLMSLVVDSFNRPRPPA